MKSSTAVRSDYPRAQPYAAPPAGPKPERAAAVRLPFSPLFTLGYFLLVTAAGLLVVFVTAFCLVREKPQASVAPPLPPPLLPPKSISVANATPAPLPTKIAGLPAIPTTSADRSAPFLEAIGALSAAQLYQSYLNIGFLADAVELDSYTEAEADKLLQAVQDMLAMVDQQLARLDQLDLSPDDQRSLSRLRTIRVTLRTQARTLQSYWANGDPEQLNRYHEARDQAWALLREMN